MRLLLIRHGDPDYTIDGLTETGRREAALLAERIAPMEISEYYVSTMGRAKETARPTLEKAGREALACDWLREFDVRVHRPDCEGELSYVPWDWLPQDWLKDPILLDRERWHEHPVFAEMDVKSAYDRVIAEFERVLARHGYVREGLYYRAERPNSETLAFFCHFGLSCVLMSRLMNVSPMVLWQGLVMAPSSVTTIYTEERRPGIASFRAAAVGDISHLYVRGQAPSFAARFCEVYGNGERVD
ncbi:MAG: histidine phosphatase family protein [Oscillospiraceae bacterium]|nr:histidine phosphatase family protein [Oscillospiraceae bacterium]